MYLCYVLIATLVMGVEISFAISVGTVDCCVRLSRMIRWDIVGCVFVVGMPCALLIVVLVWQC